ncbi:hypothetical protein GJR95_41015 [Spirosoma endbachense]|uniref:Uncharacterized protein n=1 Tax=Spirosoma endbachense TaxID=2666025 RepID=A0A6P1W7M7_9BACT|nr:hypothetical protein GJR95_41015 [Spirosoma endbachense]
MLHQAGGFIIAGVVNAHDLPRTTDFFGEFEKFGPMLWQQYAPGVCLDKRPLVVPPGKGRGADPSQRL